MEYGQFIKILEGENLNRKETVEQLKEIIQQYPYFQTAHILLAKALQEQNNIDFDRALKLASVYSGDRTVLFSYINKNGVREIVSEVPEEVSYAAEEIQREVPEVKAPETIIPVSTYTPKEEPYKEYFSEEEILGIDEEEESEKKEKIYDPQDLIRKRLSEILASPSPPKEGPESAQSPTESTIIEPEQKVESQIPPSGDRGAYDKDGIISVEAEKARDFLEMMEVEHALEISILESLEKLPPINKESQEEKTEARIEKPKEIPSEQTDTSSPRTFTEWLKAKSSKPFNHFEEVHSTNTNQYEFANEETLDADESEEESASEEALIDKFIETEPRIVPSKTEFYSPANQAKKSIIEHQDVVSETLARIYKGQGYLDRARWCYERLSLLHPEKRSYFAALLKEIDDINKEDL